jgi:hypothetical protein
MRTGITAARASLARPFNIGRLLALTAATAASALFVVAPVVAQPGPPAWTGITLPAAAHRGQDAIDKLGPRIAEVAAWYGKSAEHVAHMLRTDPTLAVDRGGRLFHAEERPTRPGPAPATARGRATTGAAAATPGAGAGAALASAYTAEQTFLMHSRPGASRVIYLDFNGHVAQGTVWNSVWGVSTINSPAFDLDGNPAAFSDGELAAIRTIWQRVAEDFAAFDVDVTTEEPPADRLVKSSSTDTQFGWRAVITRDWTQQTSRPCGCSGYAYIGIFGNPYYAPSYVFHDQLLGNEKYIADGISHEVGHALGLSHDGTSTSAYYWGHGAGVTSWGPIMGAPYYQTLTQWSRGEYPDANNGEDDLAIIAQNLPRLADDVAGTYAQATTLSGASEGGMTRLQASAMIGSAGDIDVFAFTSGPGLATFTVAGLEFGSNLKVYADLRDAAGNIVTAANPSDGLGATLAWTIPAAGQYYLVVAATGWGDAWTGFTAYGDVGQYTVTGQVPTVAGAVPPVAVASGSPTAGVAPLAVTLSAAGSSDPDGAIVTWEWDFGDGSPLAYGPVVSHAYAAGSWTATLRVVDATGLWSTAAVAVSATQPVAVQKSMSVGGMTMTAAKNKNGTVVTTTVAVRDGNGNPLPNATVTGAWTGKYAAGASAVTAANGIATFVTPKIGGQSGTETFTVNAVAQAGYAYDAQRNVVSVDTVRW